ncbi:ComEC/Rec2 family competence protein [Prosthecobacter sp.]|uniref:ComEC/Rec2 family competence protein n=1 Tax=Prosthecobacter sp. TaxID=1965333 RepID=UPI002487D3FC|nr:ComEC/Rec2 family competence protein [Prosthecobacter sp.]MDI1311466.1 ComEC/Rec2 family competence protein [Prosthecobacter sp.]
MLVKLQLWTRVNPLLTLALAAVIGILVTEMGWLPAHGGWFLGVTTALLSAALISGRAWLLIPGAALVFACIHTARTDETFRHPLRLALQQQDKPLPATIRGSLLPEFDTTKDERSHALCTTRKIEIPAAGIVIEQAATLLVRLPKGVRFPGAGVFELHGSIYLPRTASNPGTFDAQEYSLRMGRVGRFDIDHMQRLSGSGETWWCGFLERAELCRQWISRQLIQDLEEDPQTVAVLRAMALGMSAEADDEIEDAFRNSGTLHVFAVSGLHVGLLGVIVLILLQQTRTPRAVSLWIVIFVVFAYAFVTGWRPSAARAAFMVVIYLSATLVDRESSLQNSLGAAALLLLATDSNQLFMPGFQLSFGVLWLSTIGSAPLLKRLQPFTRLDPFLPPQLANWRQRGWSTCRLWFATTLSVSFAAWIGSLPFILGHFHSITPVAVIANCVLVPLSSLCLGTTCLSLCAAALHLTGVQIIFNNVNWALAKAMIASAMWFAGLPGGNFHFQPTTAPTHAPAAWHMLELPHGGAANHLRSGKTHWLFDIGSEASFRRVLRPYLHSNGVNTIAGVFLSHNDADHIGAAGQVLTTFDAPLLYCSSQEPGRRDASRSALRRLLDQPHPPSLRKLHVDERVTLSDAKAFNIDVQVLYPTQQVQNDRGDDRAMVLMVQLGPWRVLWLSDTGWHAEKALCSSSQDLHCDVMIRSQHEVDLSTSAEFLIRTRPQIILCGSDARTVETALPASLVQRAKELNIPLLDTWSSGSIALEFHQDEIRIVTNRSKQQLVLKPR